VAFTRDGMLLGFSETAENISPWPGGCRPFARTDDMVNRSEFKLLEALESFKALKTLPGGRALDLGGAPGGWTRVLRKLGMLVTAIDPAELDGRVADDHGVTHIRTTARKFLSEYNGPPFDLLTNDMKMDAPLSAEITVLASAVLSPGAPVVLTLKMPGRDWAGCVRKARQTLLQAFGRFEARQLFHNRREVTCAAIYCGQL